MRDGSNLTDARSAPEAVVAAREASWLDAAAIVWLIVVLVAYGFVVGARLDVPFRELVAELPEVGQLGMVALPAVAVTLMAGIIRYFRLRRAPRTEPRPEGSGNGGGDSS